jgi:hypothetical protein
MHKKRERETRHNDQPLAAGPKSPPGQHPHYNVIQKRCLQKNKKLHHRRHPLVKDYMISLTKQETRTLQTMSSIKDHCCDANEGQRFST